MLEIRQRSNQVALEATGSSGLTRERPQSRPEQDDGGDRTAEQPDQ